jgi:DNA-binding CsgD family transcriptional regulator
MSAHGKHHRWTNADERRLAQLWLEGHSEYEIAYRMDLRINQVRGRVLKMRADGANVPRRERSRQWTQEQQRDLIIRWTSGSSTKEIARALGRSEDAISVKISRLRGKGGDEMPARRVPTTTRKVAARQIIEQICEEWGVKPHVLKSPSRERGIMKPRQIAMALCYRLSGNSLSSIGKMFGGRHHTTVYHASLVAAAKYPDEFARAEASVMRGAR